MKITGTKEGGCTLTEHGKRGDDLENVIKGTFPKGTLSSTNLSELSVDGFAILWRPVYDCQITSLHFQCYQQGHPLRISRQVTGSILQGSALAFVAQNKFRMMWKHQCGDIADVYFSG